MHSNPVTSDRPIQQRGEADNCLSSCYGKAGCAIIPVGAVASLRFNRNLFPRKILSHCEMCRVMAESR